MTAKDFSFCVLTDSSTDCFITTMLSYIFFSSFLFSVSFCVNLIDKNVPLGHVNWFLTGA